MDSARLSGPSSNPLSDYSPVPTSASAPRRRSRAALLETSGAVWRALDVAVNILAAATPDDLPAERRRTVAKLSMAAAAIRDHAGRVAGLPSREMPSIDRSAVDALRSEFLRQLSPDRTIDSRSLILVLQAFDELARAATHREVLSDYSGFEALVEVAHDMRSPLTSILFLVDVIRRSRSGPLTAAQERQLGLIYGAALGLSTLASDLIDHVRGGAGLVDGPPAPFSITDVMLGVVDIVTPIAEEKALDLSWTPATIDDRMGYAAAIGRVLLNLTTNAVKYTHSGSVRIECTDCVSSGVVFSVTDTGTGIPDEVQRSLFSAFRRTSGRVRFSNSGLGLSICQTLLSAMGSDLHVETSPECGTRFWFALELPRADLTAGTARPG